MNSEIAGVAGEKFDALFCVAGGWAGGDASHESFIKNTDLMMKQRFVLLLSLFYSSHYFNLLTILLISTLSSYYHEYDTVPLKQCLP